MQKRIESESIAPTGSEVGYVNTLIAEHRNKNNSNET